MSQAEFSLQAPANSVICTVTEKSDVNALKSALDQAGYKGDDVVVGHGEEWLKQIDPDGSHHGGMKRVLRMFQRFTTTVDDRTLHAAEEALTTGKYLVLTFVDGSDSQRDEVHELMKEHNGTHIFFSGLLTSRLLSGW